jgi:hypothetical protein
VGGGWWEVVVLERWRWCVRVCVEVAWVVVVWCGSVEVWECGGVEM